MTPGLLRVIHKQVGHQAKVTQAVLADKWRGVCLSQVRVGRDNPNVDLTKAWKQYKYNVKVDLDHLLLDGGWKRGEVDWLRWVEPRDTKNTQTMHI